jgi:hypothetical protein
LNAVGIHQPPHPEQLCRTLQASTIFPILSLSKDGAISPARGVGAALALPVVDSEMMQLHNKEIALNVAQGAQAALLLDCAGWHTTANLWSGPGTSCHCCSPRVRQS